MIASEFSQFVDDLIVQLSPHWRGVATDFFNERGKGAVVVELHDAEEPEDRISEIKYLTADELPVGGYLRQRAADYDPQREFVVCVGMDGMVVTRCLTFSAVRNMAASFSDSASGLR